MSSQGVDPWVELRKRRRMDLFDGRINHLFPVAPAVGGASSSDSAFRRVAMFLESCRRARRGRGADEARHGNAGPRRSARVPVPRRTLNEMAPDVYSHWPMACEVRQPGESSEEEMETSTSTSTSTGDASSRPVSEANSGSLFSFNERHSGSGDNASHVSTAVDPIGSPVVLNDAVPAGVQRPVVSLNVAESSDEDMDEVGESAEEELPVYEIPLDDDNLSIYVTGSSVSVSPEIGSFRVRSRPIVSDEAE